MTNHQLVIVSTLAYIVSAISFICTVMSLVLIKAMKKWNGFLAILWAMAICQLVFDVSFSRHITSDSSYVSSKDEFTTSLWDGLQYFGGLSVSIWTNILAIVVVKVVVTFEGFNIRKNFYMLSTIALVPPALICILNIALYKDHYNTGGQTDRIGQIYSYSRAVSIVINFVCYAIISIRARKIGSHADGFEISQQQLMINELSRRMIYYPLMQTVSRIGASVYEPVYGYGPYLGKTSEDQFATACVYAITAPAAGIGYLIIFLIMQPYAYEQFVAILTTCRTIPAPASSVSSSTNRKYSGSMMSDPTVDGGGSSTKSPSTLSGFSGFSSHSGSTGFHDTHSRGSGTLRTIRRVANNLGRQQREDSVIKYLDDDELIKAIKESWKSATVRRSTLSLRPSDRESATSSVASSSLYSRDTDVHSAFTSSSQNGQALLRANTLQNRDLSLTSSTTNTHSSVANSSVEMGSVTSFMTAMTNFRGINNNNNQQLSTPNSPVKVGGEVAGGDHKV